MLVCEDCGCLVEPDLADTHQEFHDDLLLKSELNQGSVANPNRTRVDENGFSYQEC